jgi:hypothetical protein
MKRTFIVPLVFSCLARAAFGADAAAAACQPPAPARTLVEHFLPADCLDCWQAPGEDGAAPVALRLDWILPAGADAPLAAAALPEAAERWRAAVRPQAHEVARAHALPAAPPGARLGVQSGLAWNGYMGLSFELAGSATWPADARGWVALVERVPAGADGTAVARNLVRAVAGPFGLHPPAGQDRLLQVYAVRMPANAQPERLAAVGWIERDDGQVLMAAQSPLAACTPDPQAR